MKICHLLQAFYENKTATKLLNYLIFKKKKDFFKLTLLYDACDYEKCPLKFIDTSYKVENLEVEQSCTCDSAINYLPTCINNCLIRSLQMNFESDKNFPDLELSKLFE